MELYIKAGSLPTNTSFDIRQIIKRDQKSYTVPTNQLSGTRGFLMIVAKGLLLVLLTYRARGDPVINCM